MLCSGAPGPRDLLSYNSLIHWVVHFCLYFIQWEGKIHISHNSWKTNKKQDKQTKTPHYLEKELGIMSLKKEKKEAMHVYSSTKHKHGQGGENEY